MDKILHDPKDPKLWELWYIPYYGSCRILSINRSNWVSERVCHRGPDLFPRECKFSGVAGKFAGGGGVVFNDWNRARLCRHSVMSLYISLQVDAGIDQYPVAQAESVGNPSTHVNVVT